MIETMKGAAEAQFRLAQLDIGDYSTMKGKGMKFKTQVFDAEGAGRLCLMEMKAVGGLMRMETGVFSSTELDGPLFSFDYIKAAGKETLLLEFYDTTISHPQFEELLEVKDKYAHLTYYDPGEHWYDDMRLPASDYKTGKKITEELRSMLRDYCKGYFRLLAGCDNCDSAEKKECNAAFADGLLQNGGPAVDTFKKMIGDEKTEEFLKTYMFCCQ